MASLPRSFSPHVVKDEPVEVPLDSPATPLQGPPTPLKEALPPVKLEVSDEGHRAAPSCPPAILNSPAPPQTVAHSKENRLSSKAPALPGEDNNGSQKPRSSPTPHGSKTVSNQREPPGGQVWAMSEADLVREQLRKVMEKMLDLQNQVQESCGLGGEELREVQQLALQSAAILEGTEPKPGASEGGLRSGVQGGVGSEQLALRWIGEQYKMESGQEAISSGLAGAAAFGREVNGCALEDGGAGAEGSGGGARKVQSFGNEDAPLAKTPALETAIPESVPQRGGVVETKNYVTFPARTLPPHASPSLQGEAALSDGPGARSSEGSVSEDEYANVKNAPAVKTAELAAAKERRPSPGSDDPQAAPLKPQTPAKVCVKTEWSEEPETPNPLVVDQVNSEGLSQADPGVNGYQEWRGPLHDDDVGSGLEDDDDGFDSEPEPNPDAERPDLNSEHPVVEPVNLFGWDSDGERERSVDPGSEGNAVFPSAAPVRKQVVKKKSKGVKKAAGAGKGQVVKHKGGKSGASQRQRDKWTATGGEERQSLKEKREWQSYERQFKTCFTRVMQRSFVYKPFWLGVGKQIAEKHFWGEGERIFLMFSADSKDVKHRVKWLYRTPDKASETSKGKAKNSLSRGFSGGWAQVATALELYPGDSVVFEPVGKKEVQLHVFRRSQYGGDVARTARVANKTAGRLDDLAERGGSWPSEESSKGSQGEEGPGALDAGMGSGLGEWEAERGDNWKHGKVMKRKRSGEEGAPVVERQKMLTDCFKVVKKAKLAKFAKLAKPLAETSFGFKKAGLGGHAAPAGGAEATAVKRNSSPESSGGGGKTKVTPKRADSLQAKKRAKLDSGALKHDASKEKKAGAPRKHKAVGAVNEEEEERIELDPETGRRIHRVEGGHVYVEAEPGWQEAAKQAMRKCKSAYPSFRAVMRKSYIDKGFWLGGMSKFLHERGFRSDDMVALADPRGYLWNTRVKKGASAFSGGWRGFALDHTLEVGDGLVFENVFRYCFRVRIFRASKRGAEDDCSEAGVRNVGARVTGEERSLTSSQKKELARILGLAGGLPVKPTSLWHPMPSPKAPPPKLPLTPPPVSKVEEKSPNTMLKRPKASETKRTEKASESMEERPSERPILPGGGSLRGETGPEALPLDEIGSIFSDGDLAPRNKDQKAEEEERGTGQGLTLKKKRNSDTYAPAGGPALKHLKVTETVSQKTDSALTHIASLPIELEEELVRGKKPDPGSGSNRSVPMGWTQIAPQSVKREVPAVKHAGPAIQRVLPPGDGQQEDRGPGENQSKQEQRPRLGVSGNKASVKAASGKSDAVLKVQPSAKGSKGGMKLVLKKVVKSNVELMRERLMMMQ